MVNGKPIYSEKSEPMRVVVLFSGGASGARYILSEPGPGKTNYKVVAGITDTKDSPGIGVFTQREIPVEVANKEKSSSQNEENRKSGSGYFDRLTSKVKQYDPDLLLLSGFMQVVKPPLITTYPGKIINVHPADLRITENGRRKYTGDDGVYEAIIEGEKELRSTVHIVTQKLDGGPILVVSKPVPVERRAVATFQRFNQEMIRKYADLVQEWMKWSCDGPSIHKALTLIARGEVRYNRGKVTLNGPEGFTPGYYDIGEGKVVPVKDEGS